MSAKDKPVIVEDDGGTRVMRLNRPSRGNALDGSLGAALLDEVRTASQDPRVRVIVLTGEGRSFCSGDDIAGVLALLGKGDRSSAAADDTGAFHYPVICAELLQAPKPVIAAINGTVAGAGLEIACAADVRLCSTDARFGVKVLSIGHAGCAALLPRVIGWARTTELFLSSDWVGPTDAADMGLVSSVHDADALLPHTLRMASTLATGATRAIGHFKDFRRRTEALGPIDAVLLQQQLHEAVLTDVKDAAEGPQAHLERRAPRFSGR